MERVRIPKLSSVHDALRIRDENIWLDNDTIRELFPTASRSTIQKLKTNAREVMEKKGITGRPYVVHTDCAYEAWGLEYRDLNERSRRLVALEKRMKA